MEVTKSTPPPLFPPQDNAEREKRRKEKERAVQAKHDLYHEAHEARIKAAQGSKGAHKAGTEAHEKAKDLYKKQDMIACYKELETAKEKFSKCKVRAGKWEGVASAMCSAGRVSCVRFALAYGRCPGTSYGRGLG